MANYPFKTSATELSFAISFIVQFKTFIVRPENATGKSQLTSHGICVILQHLKAADEVGVGKGGEGVRWAS